MASQRRLSSPSKEGPTWTFIRKPQPEPGLGCLVAHIKQSSQSRPSEVQDSRLSGFTVVGCGCLFDSGKGGTFSESAGSSRRARRNVLASLAQIALHPYQQAKAGNLLDSPGQNPVLTLLHVPYLRDILRRETFSESAGSSRRAKRKVVAS